MLRFETDAAFGQIEGFALVRLDGPIKTRIQFTHYAGVAVEISSESEFFAEDYETNGHGVGFTGNDTAIFGGHELPPQERVFSDFASDYGRGKTRIASAMEQRQVFVGRSVRTNSMA